MGFFDKASEYVEREVSTVELADIIEEKILKKEYESDFKFEVNLEILKDAMKKDWILIVRGATTRNYVIPDPEITVSVHYSYFTHTMQTVQLKDKQEKIVYSIPKGRNNAKDLCSKVLARVDRYKKSEEKI